MPQRIPGAVFRWVKENVMDAVVVTLLVAVAFAATIQIRQTSDTERGHFKQEIAALQQEAQQRCRDTQSNRVALRRILTFAETATLTRNPPPSPQQVDATAEFYKEALALVPTLNCPPLQGLDGR